MRVALGTDVGAGTSFSLLRDGLQAYFMQALLGAEGLPLTPAHMLHLASAAGAKRWTWPTRSGTSRWASTSMRCGSPRSPATPSMSCCRHAADPDDALAKVFALAGPSDVQGVWVGGDRML